MAPPTQFRPGILAQPSEKGDLQSHGLRPDFQSEEWCRSIRHARKTQPGCDAGTSVSSYPMNQVQDEHDVGMHVSAQILARRQLLQTCQA